MSWQSHLTHFPHAVSKTLGKPVCLLAWQDREGSAGVRSSDPSLAHFAYSHMKSVLPWMSCGSVMKKSPVMEGRAGWMCLCEKIGKPCFTRRWRNPQSRQRNTIIREVVRHPGASRWNVFMSHMPGHAMESFKLSTVFMLCCNLWEIVLLVHTKEGGKERCEMGIRWGPTKTSSKSLIACDILSLTCW